MVAILLSDFGFDTVPRIYELGVDIRVSDTEQFFGHISILINDPLYTFTSSERSSEPWGLPDDVGDGRQSVSGTEYPA